MPMTYHYHDKKKQFNLISEKYRADAGIAIHTFIGIAALSLLLYLGNL